MIGIESNDPAWMLLQDIFRALDLPADQQVELGRVIAAREVIRTTLAAPAPLVWRENDPEQHKDAVRDPMTIVYRLPDGRLLLWDSRGSRNCVAGPFTIAEPGR